MSNTREEGSKSEREVCMGNINFKTHPLTYFLQKALYILTLPKQSITGN